MAGPLRCLLVEDSESDAGLIVRQLEKAGYEVVHERVETAGEMRAALEERVWDVVIADHTLPEFSAPAALALLQQTGLDLPFLVVSGTLGEQTAVAMMKAGAHDYLMKDDLIRLAPAMERELREAEMRRDSRRAEEALRQSEVRFRQAIMNAPWPIMIHAEGGQVLLVNNAWTEQSGYDPEDIPTTADWTERVYGEKKDLVDADIEALYRLDIPKDEGEYAIRTKGGETRLWQLSSAPLGQLPGGRRMVISMAMDVTERDRAEEQVRQSRETIARQLGELAFIYASAPVGLCALDIDFRFLQINERLAETNGLPVAAHLGRMIWEVLPELAPQLEPIYRTVIDSGRPVLDVEIHGATPAHPGVARDWLASYYPLKDGSRVVGINAVVQEITERKQAQAELRRSEENYRRIVETAAEGIMEIDQQERIVFVNQRMADMFGYSPGELIGRPVFDLMDEEERAAARANLARRREGVKEQLEFKYRRKDGSPLWAIVAATPIYDSDHCYAGALTMVTDITERKQAEERMKESEEKFRKAFMTGADAFYLATLEEGLILDVNDRFEELWGYPRDEAIGKTSLELGLYVNPDDRVRWVAECRRSGQVRDLELQTRKKSGEIITILISINRLSVGSGELILGAVRDITARKRMEEALRESERRYRELFENAHLGVYRTTPDGRILLANPALVAMLGYSSLDELADRNLEEDGFEPGYDRGEFKCTLQEQDELRGREAAWKRRDGVFIHVRENAKAVRDTSGAVVYYDGTVEDITERKRAEEALTQSEEKFRGMAEQMADVLFVTDSRGAITYLSPSASLVFGWSPEEMTGRHFTDFLAEEDIPKALSVFHAAVAFGQPAHGLALTMKRKDGSAFAGELNGSMIEKDAVAAGTMGIIRDITERKRAEEELRKHRDHLEELVKERTAELEENNAKLAAEIRERASAQEALREKAVELESFNRAMVGREKRIIDLKEEVNRLCLDLHRPPPYPPVWEQGRP